MNKIDSKSIKTILFEHKSYKRLAIYILLSYGLFILLYLNRPALYDYGNTYLDLIIGSVANFIPSILFSLIAIFYIVPLLTGTFKTIANKNYLFLISAINLSVFVLIEYVHVLLSLARWDHIDILASIIGIVIAYVYHSKVKSTFSSTKFCLY
ncbi:MAG: hypothetical protein WBA54_15835 [Acidaminobacteraceae bacterium]